VTESSSETLAALAVAPIDDSDVGAVVALWQACDLTRPWNDPHADIALARRSPNATILVGRQDGRIIATGRPTPPQFRCGD